MTPTFSSVIPKLSVRPQAQAIAAALDKHSGAILTTPLRKAHFLAQALHETAGFLWLEEVGGTDYFTRMYEGTNAGRRLGNTETGDGARFHGRGIFQLTGRSNYTEFGKLLDLPLVTNPNIAADSETSVRIALLYWTNRRCNVPADRDDIRGVTRLINGGYNGIDDRIRWYSKAARLFDVI